MFIPMIKSNESIYSYMYRLAKLNSLLTLPFFHKYIIQKSGKIVNVHKLEEKLYEFIGDLNYSIFEEVIKRKQGVLNNHRVDLGPTYYKSEERQNEDKPLEMYSKFFFCCPACIKEQIHCHGHSWLKLDWLHNHSCHIHKTKLLNLTDVSIDLNFTFFEIFKMMFHGHIPNNGKQITYKKNQLLGGYTGIIAPCVLIDYFISSNSHKIYDLQEYSCSFVSLVSLLYQHVNNFASDEKDKFRHYLQERIDVYHQNGIYLYKTQRKSCSQCEQSSSCVYSGEKEFLSVINEKHIESILSYIFQQSCLPEHINDNQLKVYTDLRTHLSEYFAPLSYESVTINWLLYLIASTYSTHSEFISRSGEFVEFGNIMREQVSGMVVLKLKRERINSSDRIIPLPRNFELQLKRYIEKCYNGKFEVNHPLIVSKMGGNSIASKELNRMLREAFKEYNKVPVDGQNLHSIRDSIIASAIEPGSNMEYLTKSSGLVSSQLLKPDILPMRPRAYG